MSYSSYEKAIRALVEGGLRMINNMIPDAPTPRQIRQTIQPSRPAVQAAPAGQAVQPRLNVPPDTQTGRFQKQLPVPREVPAEQVPRRAGYPQADVPREALPARVPGIAPGQRSLPVGQEIPRSTTVRPYPIPSSPQAPEPAFAYGKELMRRDPEGYGRIRSIVETTAAERGVNPDAVMEALLGAEGFDSPLIRQLEATPAQYLNRGGALTRTPESLTESGIERVNVYEVPQAQRALPKATSVDSQSSSFRIPLDELDGLVIGTRQKTAMGVDDVTNLNQLRKLGLNDAEASYVLNKANTAPYVFQRGATPSTAAGQTPPRANAMGGVNTVDLGQIFSSPAAAQAAAAGGTEAARRMPVAPFVGGGILGGLGLAAFMSGRQEQLPAPGETQLGVPTATPEFGANTPSVTGAPVASAPQPIAGSTNAIPGTVNPSSLSAPSTPAAPSLPAPVGGRAPSGPVGSSMGAGSVPQLMDSRDSEYRQAVQNAAQGLRQDASQYKNIGDLYSVQSAYANAPGRAEQIVGALKGMGAPASVGIENEANFETWARANPELAYRLQLQMQRRGPSQQMPVAQGAVLGTSMGTNTPNNAAGQARAAAMNAAFGTQGAADLNATLAPQAYQTLEKMPLF